MKRVMVLLGVTFLVTACAGEKTTSVQSIQKKDKELSCTDVLLEMNEAEFYKNSAENKKQPSLKNVIMPLGYVSTYMNSEEAINAADSRIGYLNKIYEIMHCDQEFDQRYGNAKEQNPKQLALAKSNSGRQAEADYAAPVPYVQQGPSRKIGRYVPGAYAQPAPGTESYLANTPYPDGYSPIRPRYEERRRANNQGYYGYGYNAPSYEETIPEGAPVQSGY